MDNAFEFVMKNGGICSEIDYPYTGTENTCTKCIVVPNTSPISYSDVESTEESMLFAVARQPISVAIQADQISFQFYKTGVLTGKCGTELDHGVLIVGYGELDGISYYKVKNSWSVSWGMDGYILIERNKDQLGGQCGYLLSGSYPNY